MALNRIIVEAPPEAVFSVLADAGCYPTWLVGAKEIRDADPSWPAPGSTFHHSVGVGPLVLRDSTTAVQRDEPRMLVLHARIRPVTVANVTFSLEPAERGTAVTIVEEPVAGLASWPWLSPVFDRLVRLRNAASLRRLKRVTEARRR